MKKEEILEKHDQWAAIDEYAKENAIGFMEWVSDGWVLIDSVRLGKSAWVNCMENKVYAHGSDLHYTTLINSVGKTTEQLYDIYKIQNQTV